MTDTTRTPRTDAMTYEFTVDYGEGDGLMPFVRKVDYDDLRATLIAKETEAAELRAALAGMLSIHDSVTQGQEREFREKWIPIARATIKKARG